MKLDLNDIIKEPVVSEKSTDLASKQKFVFKVHKFANKPMVKKALESLYDVKVDKCNIINLKGKEIRTKQGGYSYTYGYKKVVVTLKEGQFDFFETNQ
ncbi:MAG TPA: 50S ribosomal protein L23 [Spirochaetia bacterium]|nr:MAG: 50S ribosomal protein L23 [Spirochaetes bacterium GWB1_36_13]HCL57338.1 50S ribosomal protein L23 [Spirochaetia bacterium]